jgi:hypothetical protein
MAKSTSNNTVHVPLNDGSFEGSVERYIDEDKPNTLQQKQMEAWRVEWKDELDAKNCELSFEPTHRLTGTLSLHGEYIVVNLASECYWQGDGTDGSLFFRCRASAHVQTDIDDAAARTEPSAKDRKKEAKIRTKVIDRLRHDDYVGKLLLGEPLELCQAAICMQSDNPESQLEERVHCSEVTAEAIRRAVFSSAESPLDIFDLVCRLPLLPCTAYQSLVSHTTVLADRAKLRLLEDATYDACENEAEDELVEELKLEKEESKTTKRSKR